MAKILIATVPFHGHVNQTLEVAKALVDAGHEVTYTLIEDFRSKVEATGAKFVSYENSNKGFLMSGMMKGIYDCVYELAKEHDCIVYDFMFMLGRDIGKKLNKPVIRLYPTFALDKELFMDVFSGPGLLSKSMSYNLSRKIITKIFFSKIDLDTTDVIEEMSTDKIGMNIVFTTEKFQIDLDRFDKKKYKFVGHLNIKNNYECNIPLEKIKNKLIYISLGTVFNKSVSFFKKCIQAFKDEDVTVIIATGGGVEKEKLGEIPDNFYVEKFVPQNDILEKADLFITHGGMNSASDAIYCGVPTIVLPQSLDQFTVARRMEELKLGKAIMKTKKVSVEELKAYAKEVLEDKTYKNNVLEMSKDFKSMPGVENIVNIIEEFAGLKDIEKILV